jgi:hypothetical protein
MRSVLAKRIEGYYNRTKQDEYLLSLEECVAHVREKTLIATVFEDPMRWGFDVERNAAIEKDPNTVMSTLSRHRPRWMVELAQLAAKVVDRNGTVIRIQHIASVLQAFGRTRITDLAAEYRSECPQIAEIIEAFANVSEDLTTADLESTITNRILPHVPIEIAGVGKVMRATQVAAFLYEIGFLTARRNNTDGTYDHFTFAEEPSPLHNRTNIDRGMSLKFTPYSARHWALGTKREGRLSARVSESGDRRRAADPAFTIHARPPQATWAHPLTPGPSPARGEGNGIN